MSTTDNKSIVFTMRFNPKLHNVIKTLAEEEKRSMAKQIEHMLENYLTRKNK